MVNGPIENNGSSSTHSSLWQSQDSLELTLERWNKEPAEGHREEPPQEEEGTRCTTTTTGSHSNDDDDDEITTNTGRRRVTFSRTGRSKKTLSLKNYTDEEKSRCFYTRKEYLDMRRENLANIERLQNDKSPRKGDSFRGLEIKTQKGRVAMKRHLDRAKLVVLNYNYEELGGKAGDWELNAELLASLYKSASAECSNVAMIVGKQDEEQAKGIYLAPYKPLVNKARKCKTKQRVSKSSVLMNRESPIDSADCSAITSEKNDEKCHAAYDENTTPSHTNERRPHGDVEARWSPAA